MLDRLLRGKVVQVPDETAAAIFGIERERRGIAIGGVNPNSQPSQTAGDAETAVPSRSQDDGWCRCIDHAGMVLGVPTGSGSRTAAATMATWPLRSINASSRSSMRSRIK